MTEVLGVLIAELVEVGEDDRGSLLFRDLAESSEATPTGSHVARGAPRPVRLNDCL